MWNKFRGGAFPAVLAVDFVNVVDVVDAVDATVAHAYLFPNFHSTARGHQ